MTTKTRRAQAADASTNAIPAPERDLEKEIMALKAKIGKLEDSLRIQTENLNFVERRARPIIEAHIASKRALLSALNEKARIELEQPS